MAFDPFSAGEAILQCQYDEIYNHNLGPDCQARATDLPYDYRQSQTNVDSFHRHGVPNEDGYDRHGHFGDVEGCSGRVIHYVQDDDVVLSDSSEEQTVEQMTVLVENETGSDVEEQESRAEER